MKKLYLLTLLCILMFFPASAQKERDDAGNGKDEIKKVLFIGDSMTGWLAERLNAYGKLNGFDVSTIVWDGSTISKWANSPKLQKNILLQEPDAIFISLGMNELFEQHPETRLKTSVDKIIKAADGIPMIWVGPPSWPGHNKGDVLNDWLEEKLGEKHFFRSFDLTLPRQSAKNPHPNRTGMVKWMDAVVEWIGEENIIPLRIVEKPEASQMSRGKVFIYKRMNETL